MDSPAGLSPAALLHAMLPLVFALLVLGSPIDGRLLADGNANPSDLIGETRYDKQDAEIMSVEASGTTSVIDDDRFVEEPSKIPKLEDDACRPLPDETVDEVTERCFGGDHRILFDYPPTGPNENTHPNQPSPPSFWDPNNPFDGPPRPFR